MRPAATTAPHRAAVRTPIPPVPMAIGKVSALSLSSSRLPPPLPLILPSTSHPPPPLVCCSLSLVSRFLPAVCRPPSAFLPADHPVFEFPAAIEAAVGGQSTSADRQARHCVVLPPAAAGASTDSACSSSHRQMSSPLSFSLFLSFFVVLSLFVFSLLCSSLAEAAATERSHVRRSQQQP